MDKIAKQIIEEDSTVQCYKSIKLGFCKNLSERGLSPKEAEQILEKIAESGFKIDPVDIFKQYSLILAGGGAAAGIGTAMLRNKIEKSIQGTEDQKMRSTKSKIDTYKKMIQNFRDEKSLNV